MLMPFSLQILQRIKAFVHGRKFTVAQSHSNRTTPAQ
jgi:hypothetical protein